MPCSKHPGVPTLVAALLCCPLLTHCSRQASKDDLPLPSSPSVAADQVSQEFHDAPPAIQQAVQDAQTGLRNADYDQAIVSLQALRLQQNLSLRQGIAIHNSMVTLENQILRAMDAGDPHASNAYKNLRRLKRN